MVYRPATCLKQAKPEHDSAKFEERFEKLPDSGIYTLRQHEAPINKDIHRVVGWQPAFDDGRHYFVRGADGVAIDHRANATRPAKNMCDSMYPAKSLNVPDLLLSQTIQCLLMPSAGFFAIVHCSVHSLKAAFLGI